MVVEKNFKFQFKIMNYFKFNNINNKGRVSAQRTPIMSKTKT